MMESAGEAKLFSNLVEDQAAAETSFGQFLDGNAREQGIHTPNCNAAAGYLQPCTAELQCENESPITIIELLNPINRHRNDMCNSSGIHLVDNWSSFQA